MFTASVLTTILLYTWVLEPRGMPVELPATIVVVLAGWSAIRSHTWGLARSAFAPACRAAVVFTIPAVLVVLAIGSGLGTAHLRRSPFLPAFVMLVAWGGAQQFVLQTMVLREVRQWAPPAMSVFLSAVLFALVHFPNPVLTLMTFTGAVAWCGIFIRYPNIVPLAISHAVGSLALLYAFDDIITGRLRIGHAYLTLGR